MAAGLTIRKANLVAFALAFERAAESLLQPDDFIPRLHLDCELSLAEVDDDLLEAQSHFEPFGMANPRPTYWLKNVKLAKEPAILKEKHYRFILQQHQTQHSAIYFGGAANPLPPPPWDVVFHLEANTFRGETTRQIQITHLRQSL